MQKNIAADKADNFIVAPVLNTFVATATILNQGTKFMFNGALYEITTTVTEGTSFVVGTNVKRISTLTDDMSSSADSIDVSGEPLVENAVIARCGKVRILKLSFSSLTAGSNQTGSAIIPEGDRPLFSNDFDCAEYGTSGNTYRITLFDNGYIYIFAPTTGTPNMWATCMYVTP